MTKLMYRRLKQTLLLAAFLTIGYSAPAQVTAPDFSVVVLPDTQFYSQSYPAIFNAQTQWVVSNSENYNIQFVLGEGDIVNVADQPAQWQNADAAIRLLDSAKIPYVLPLGNHDYDDFNPSARGTTAFNTYFGPSRYAQYSWYKGGFPSGTNDNFYTVFTVNGKQYLILALEFLPRQESLDWAKTVLDANPNKEIIVVTHSFLFTDSTRADQCNNNDNGGAGNNQGEDVWQNLLINYPNLSLVLNGHFTGSTASRRVDLGLQQNLVNEIFANYQSLTNGGDGWMRILTFRPSLNRIDIVTYSPYLNQYKTDSNNQFSITWHSTGTGSSTGTIAGLVRGERAAPSPYQCVAIAGATLTAGGGSASSNSDGSFSLTLPAGNYSLSAAAPGWVMTEDDEEEGAYPGFTSSAKMFLEPLLGSVSGKVTDGSGNPLNGAAVAFSGGTIPTQISATATATGTYTVPSISVGSYNVTASAAGQTTATATTTVTQGQTTTLNFQLNSSTGACSAPTSPGVSICQPVSGATVSSPVQAEAAGTVTGTMSHMELWIDGVKKFSENGNLLNTPLTLASGTHRFAFLAINTAGTKWTAAVNATVSSSGLITPTITWSNPASITYGTALSGTQLNATANVPGSFAYSPVAGTLLSVGAHTLSTTFTPTDTTHYTTATKSVSITVTSGGVGCNAPTSPGVTVCSPASGATVSSPVAIQAASNVTGTFNRMEVWIDGVKKYSETSSKALNTTLTLSAGTHRFAILAFNTAGT
ncbi:MAG: carboxypeptidase regulatory-like domain-containing protein, partial [Acidobacteriaceae bacterium]